jgi:hypothetical protein
VDDLEKNYKFGGKNIKKIIDVIINITIYNAFIYLFLNEKFKLISKYLNINM